MDKRNCITVVAKLYYNRSILFFLPPNNSFVGQLMLEVSYVIINSVTSQLKNDFCFYIRDPVLVDVNGPFEHFIPVWDALYNLTILREIKRSECNSKIYFGISECNFNWKRID